MTVMMKLTTYPHADKSPVWAKMSSQVEMNPTPPLAQVVGMVVEQVSLPWW